MHSRIGMTSMRELTDEQEEVLGLVYSHKDSLPEGFTGDGKAMKPFEELREAGMIKAELDMSGTFAHVMSLSSHGVSHMNFVKQALLTSGLEPLSDEAELALRDLAWEETQAKAAGTEASHTLDNRLDDAYRELKRKDMIDAFGADNAAIYALFGITDTGWKYVRAMVPDPSFEKGSATMPPINITNTNTNTNTNSATAISTVEITLGQTIEAIKAEDGLTKEDKEELSLLLAEAKAANEPKSFADKAVEIIKKAGSCAGALIAVMKFLACVAPGLK